MNQAIHEIGSGAIPYNMRQSFTDRQSNVTMQTVQMINYIKKATKNALTPLIGRNCSQDEITRVMTNLLEDLRGKKTLDQFSVDVEPGGRGPFTRIKESDEIAGMLPGDQYGNTGLVVQRDDKGAIIFDPTVARTDDVLNIRVNLRPVQTLKYIAIAMEVKK